MPHEYPVVIPAAGASRRMGRSKPLLPFDGRTGIELVLSACREAGCGPIRVVLGDGADAVRAALPPGGGVEVVINPNHERGQTGSVKCGLRSLDGPAAGFLIFPADHPLVEGADIRRLVEAFELQEPGEGAIPIHGGTRGHPILLGWKHREGVLSLDDEAPLHDYVRPRLGGFARVEMDNAGVVLRMNTEREYQEALEAYRRRRAETG